MNEIIKNIEEAQMKAEVPAFNVGDTVRVSAKIKEGNRERIQVFEGTVLKKQGTGVRSTFTVRKISNGVGVEKTWPLHSPIVEKVDVVMPTASRAAPPFWRFLPSARSRSTGVCSPFRPKICLAHWGIPPAFRGPVFCASCWAL